MPLGSRLGARARARGGLVGGVPGDDLPQLVGKTSLLLEEALREEPEAGR